MTRRLAEVKPNSVYHAEASGKQLRLRYTTTKVTILSPQGSNFDRITESHCDRPTT
jgi:hypothetical protein